MNEKTQIYAVATLSVSVLIVFSAFAGNAAGNLLEATPFLGIAASIGIGLVCGLLVWKILDLADCEVKYRHALYWDGVEIVNEELLTKNPRNVTDAQELISVLKDRIRDLDDARNEAVEKYNELRAEHNTESE